MSGRGTHSQEFMGRPPTGKSFAITVIDICRFEHGQIVEIGAYRIGFTCWPNWVFYPDHHK
jgi:hypothetical protein